MFEKIKSAAKDFLGERHEITESVKEGLADRLSSPFYGYFLISWLVVNWDFLYSAFFVDGKIIYEKTKLLKNEYLLQRILPEHYTSFEYWISFVALPLALTFFILWPMQYLTRIVYRRHIENKKAEENIKASALAAKAKAESTIIQAETQVLKAEVAQAKLEKEAVKVSPELIWKKEYDEFKKHKLFPKFQQIINSVYEHGGSLKSDYNSYSQVYNFQVDTDILVYTDTNGIVERELSEGRILLTEKGKIFVRYYSNENVN